MKTPVIEEALRCIVWYDDHDKWLTELRDSLQKCPERENYMCPFESGVWHSEPHVIWMLLVGAFGAWGSSIRNGWIIDKEGCIAFIDWLLGETGK